MYEIFVRSQFSAAHYLRNYPGNCERPHGHNWTVEVSVRSSGLDDLGMAVDFRVVKKSLREVLSELDHTDLNELEYFREKNPSSESIAAYIYSRLKPFFGGKGYFLHRVTVGETPDTGVHYWEEQIDPADSL
ncbi:MAG: 6-carboxytetrahydropterin synthase QueD [Pseudomonadota bacterium]